jgi:hypothetical protein
MASSWCTLVASTFGHLHPDFLRFLWNFAHVDRNHPALLDLYRTGEVRRCYCGTDDEETKIQKAIFLKLKARVTSLVARSAASRMLGCTCEPKIKHYYHRTLPSTHAHHHWIRVTDGCGDSRPREMHRSSTQTASLRCVRPPSVMVRVRIQYVHTTNHQSPITNRHTVTAWFPRDPVALAAGRQYCNVIAQIIPPRKNSDNLLHIKNFLLTGVCRSGRHRHTNQVCRRMESM